MGTGEGQRRTAAVGDLSDAGRTTSLSIAARPRWAAMRKAKVEDVYLAVARTALTTGARVGELAALNLDDVDLLASIEAPLKR